MAKSFGSLTSEIGYVEISSIYLGGLVALSKKIKYVSFASILITSIASADATIECNEKVRLQIVSSAKVKCAGKYQDLFWSEKEVDVSEDGKTMSGAFSFKCPDGKRFLGLIKSTFPPNCEISKTEISHTSLVPAKTLIK